MKIGGTSWPNRLGEDLFQYIDDEEVRQTIGSEDVNYIREISGQDFTAKDFRTGH